MLQSLLGILNSFLQLLSVVVDIVFPSFILLLQDMLLLLDEVLKLLKLLDEELSEAFYLYYNVLETL